VDFDHAAELADRISKGENGTLHKQLLDMCTPYLWGVKRRLGFYWISYREVVEELALDAIADTILAVRDRNCAFAARLQNAFRDCCRQRRRHICRLSLEELKKKLDPSCLPGSTGSQSPPDIGLEQEELTELIHREMQNHGKNSKTAIYERMRGSSYEEIALILGKSAHGSRALFWDNLKRIRNSLRIRSMKDNERQGADNVKYYV